jgi:hypothetical protein
MFEVLKDMSKIKVPLRNIPIEIILAHIIQGCSQLRIVWNKTFEK